MKALMFTILLLLIFGCDPVSISPEEIVVISQPESDTVLVGDTAEFQVSVSVEDAEYTWFLDGDSVGDLDSILHYVPVAGDTVLTVYCKIQNSNSSTISDTVDLWVSYTIEIKEQPVSDTILVGDTATFSIGVNGSFPQFQWFMNDSLVGLDSILSIVAETAANNSVLCVVSNPNGETKSIPVTFSVVDTISIQKYPEEIFTFEGETATFTIEATGGDNIHYQWIKNGVEVGENSPRYSFITEQSDNSAEIHCVVYNQLDTVITRNINCFVRSKMTDELGTWMTVATISDSLRTLGVFKDRVYYSPMEIVNGYFALIHSEDGIYWDTLSFELGSSEWPAIRNTQHHLMIDTEGYYSAEFSFSYNYQDWTYMSFYPYQTGFFSDNENSYWFNMPFEWFDYGSDTISPHISVVPANLIPQEVSYDKYENIYYESGASIKIGRDMRVVSPHWSPFTKEYYVQTEHYFYGDKYRGYTTDTWDGKFVEIDSGLLTEGKVLWIDSDNTTLRAVENRIEVYNVLSGVWDFDNVDFTVTEAFSLGATFILVDTQGAAYRSDDNGVTWQMFSTDWPRKIFNSDNKTFMWDHESKIVYEKID